MSDRMFKVYMGTLTVPFFVVMSLLFVRQINPPPIGDSVVKMVIQKDGNEIGYGTGFYVGNGYYITAAHVVGDNKQIMATTANDNLPVFLTVYKVDKDNDYAILYTPFDPRNLAPAVVNCDVYHINTRINSVGYPLELGYIQTQGHIVGNIAKYGDNPTEYYRVDSVIAPGMSGGPVTNSSGEVIGINDAIIPVALPFGYSLSGFGLVVPSTKFCGDLNKLLTK